jgi:hypothetical protein
MENSAAMCAAKILNRAGRLRVDAVEKVADEASEPSHLNF